MIKLGWLHFIFVGCDVCVFGSIFAEGAFFGLNTDTGHWFCGCTFEIAVAISGNTDYGTFGDIKWFISYLETACTWKDDVVFFILPMTAIEGNFHTCGKCAEGDFTRCVSFGVLYKPNCLPSKAFKFPIDAWANLSPLLSTNIWLIVLWFIRFWFIWRIFIIQASYTE